MLTRRDLLKTLGAGVALPFASGALPLHFPTFFSTSATLPRPNIILLFADDLGYGDLGCYGAKQIRTPHLDSIAAAGIRLTDFCSCAPVCSPSRAGLLTGQYPIRLGINTVFFPQSKDGLDPSQPSISKLLQAAGYATACIGKWHLGHLPEYLPMHHGFDYYFGLPYSNDMHLEARGDPPVPLMRGHEIIEQPVDQHTLTRRYTEEAVSFIRSHSQQPFFLYLPHTMPHVPLYVSSEFAGQSPGGLYGDVVEEMDWGAGRILHVLRELDLYDNTLIIFTSDNGPWLRYGDHGGSAGPLRDGKGTTYEGGMRVPCVMQWPAALSPGQTRSFMASTLDFLPTFAAMAGVDLPDDLVLDGENLLPVLREDGSRTGEIFHYFHQGRHEAVRDGTWKLKRDPATADTYQLYDLSNDPGETRDLSATHPDIVSRMAGTMRDFWNSLQPLPRPLK